ncbi:hypothetical protein HYG86_11720 [Alkalicella caledoniensis]|uniref:DUF2268 domain-containing protein n=1 Tax=Alkalicella caledoniensis TaxID=2731377 RepID=A0A7G9W9M2_ALKCA|nr:DUF2268 domain-containing putative Zn-dependent protease [Alkalicella caledoniensis]QNO15384.1 hypothetical protein HYG86_11720 [Alkalicella caledoniensis]
MKIKFINTLKSAQMYVGASGISNKSYDELWDEFLVSPYWQELSQWAPFDCSFMKPSPIKDIQTLKKQLEIFQETDFEQIKKGLENISQILPKKDDDTLVVAFYIMDDSNLIVKEQQNGVLGTGVFGNIIININPLAKDYEKWIPYVMAHEYHHSVWGHNWYVLRGDSKGTLLEYMISEGQADAFAKSLYGDLEPKWLSKLSEEEEKLYWSKFIKILESTDKPEHYTYMFGDPSKGLPWCIGYYFGYEIVKSYLLNNPQISYTKLVDIEPCTVLSNSRFFQL